MRLAHISDLHQLDLTGVKWQRLLTTRRVFGGVNLLLNRVKEYRSDVFETLIDDLIREGVDHVVVSGDVSNLALESEFERIFHLLKLLGNGTKVSVVPGNHDYYTAGAAMTRRFEKTFYPFMFPEGFSDMDVDLYPYQKDLGEVVLFGLCSAMRTTPPLSHGRVGERQLQKLEYMLTRPSLAGRMTCVVVHHALHARHAVPEYTSRLLDRDAVLDVLNRCKVDLVLYGHDHVGTTWLQERPGKKTQFVCCGSSTRVTDDPVTMAKYRIYTIDNNKLRKLDTKIYDPSIRKFMLQ